MRSIWLVFLGLLPLSALCQNYQHIFQHFSAEDSTFPNGILDNGNATIKNLQFDQNDSLWIGTIRSGLIRFSESSPETAFVLNRRNTLLEGNEVLQVAPVSDGKIVWFTNRNSFNNSYDGLYQAIFDGYDLDSTKRIDSAYAVDSSIVAFNAEVTSLHYSNRPLFSQSLIGTNEGLYAALSTGMPAKVKGFNTAVIGMEVSSSRALFVLEEGLKVKVLTDNIRTVKLDKYSTTLGEFTPHTLRIDPSDTLWILSDEGIVKQVYNDTALVFDKAIAASALKPLYNEIKDVAFDSIGHPWMIFKNNGGVIHHNYKTKEKRAISSLNSFPKFPDEASTIVSDSDGNIWIGTDNDGLYKHREAIPISAQRPSSFQIRLFPNPATQTVKIEGLPISKNCRIDIHTLSGKLVSSTKTDDGFVDVSHLPTGAYILKAESNSGLAVTKLLIGEQ